MMVVTCPRCRGGWKVDEAAVGQTAHCPHCGAASQVRPPAGGPPQGPASRRPFFDFSFLNDAPTFKELVSAFCFYGGLLVLLFHWLAFDASAPSAGGGRVFNVGRLNDRVVGAVAGVGLMAFGAGLRRR